MSKLISSEELSRVWQLPGCLNTVDNSRGGYCAMGKLNMLASGNARTYIPSITELPNMKRYIILNDLGSFDGKRTAFDKSSFDSKSPLWNQHIKAFRLMLTEAIEHGLIELEDKAAKEFSLIKEQEVYV